MGADQRDARAFCSERRLPHRRRRSGSRTSAHRLKRASQVCRSSISLKRTGRPRCRCCVAAFPSEAKSDASKPDAKSDDAGERVPMASRSREGLRKGG